MGNTSKRYSAEVQERAVRLFQEHAHEHPSRWAAMESIAEKIGCTTETLRSWVRKAERLLIQRRNVAPADRERSSSWSARTRAAARQRDSTQGVSVFCPGGARPPREVMVAFIDAHRDRVRGRADLQAVADRPVDVLRTEGSASRSIATAVVVCGAMRSFADRSIGSGRRTSEHTEHARCGGSCNREGIPPHAARSSG